jgi:parvulin-like peptidyl-prolyl isomerase
VIELEPELDADAAEPNAAQRAAAKAKADAALADLRAGKSWDDIAKTVSTDASTAPQAGDLGWLQAEDSQTDEAFLDALFAAEANKPTAVVEGEDGIFRIGRVTEVTPESVDAVYVQKLENSNIDLAKYREVVRGDVVRKKLEDKVVAEATKAGPQREVSEIFLSEATTQLPDDAVRVRHILYSPNDDPAAANAGEIPEDDPAWAQAEADAQAAYQKLKADPSQFDAIVRAESDEESARGESGSGGDLPQYVAEGAGYVESFINPVLAAKAKDGDILAPFKTEFGYHIVQVVNHRPDLASIKAQIDGGADFATLARDFSESETADRGGDLGWIAKAQLPSALIGPIFAAPIGKTSDIATVEGDGQYLYKSRAEEVRTPEGRQLEEIRLSAFSDWYEAKKAEIEIKRGSEDTGG